MLNERKLTSYCQLMRLDKPIGILLLLWPTLWALMIAGNGEPHLKIVIIFIIGTILMRSAGCIMNDIADMRFDGFVERTKNRPLITGEVSKKEALTLAILISLIAFCLVCFTNLLTIQLSFVGLFLAASYPLTKRYFHLPQAYLGIAFGFGIPMAFAAVQSKVPTVAWLLFIANICWALAYDTEYAMVDREDDMKIGVRSSAITFGKWDVTAVMLCYCMTLFLLLIVGQQLNFNVMFYVGLLMAAVVSVQHFYLIKTRDKTKCFKAFLGNTWFGFAILIGIMLSYLTQ